MPENKNNAQIKNMLYLLWCSVNNKYPEDNRIIALEPKKLLKMCIDNKVSAFINNAVSQASDNAVSAEVKKKFYLEELKALRVHLLFEEERKKIFGLMEENQIWYMPLKGCIIKECYPKPEQRQMGDTDVLIDPQKADKLRDIMTDCGYECKVFGISNHDTYFKEPFYKFEMHRCFFIDINEKWEKYYQNIKDRLIQKKDRKYEYEFTDEDFYIYLFMHGYKHFSLNGTGIRQLVDIYLYIQKHDLDFRYIEAELEKLDVAKHEKIFRSLAFKLFSENAGIFVCQLTDEEKKYLDIILCSGVYGNIEIKVKNAVEKLNTGGKHSKFRYVMKRFFGIPKVYARKYPRLYNNILTRPLILFVRFRNGIKKRKIILKELQALRKNK